MNTDKKIAGSLLFIAGAQYIFGVSTGVHYSNSTVVEISAIFLGLIVIASAYFVQKALKSTLFSVLLILAGIGSVGAAVLTGGTTLYIFEGLGYIFFALAAIWSYKFATSPLNYMSVLLGVLAFIALALFASGINLGSGVKVSALSVDDLILPWLVGFGANIIGEKNAVQVKGN